MHAMNVADEVLTLREAAEFLKVSERTLWELAKAREIECFKVGHQYRFLRARLVAQAQQQESEV